MHPLIIQTPQHENQEQHIESYISAHVADKQKIYRIIPPGNALLIAQVREVRRDLQQSKRSGKTIVFYNFERATLEAQNALLKVLEELGDAHQFFLFTSQVDAILPTIRSRCFFHLIPAAQPDVVDSSLSEQLRALRERRSAGMLAQEVFQPATREDAIQLLNRIISALHGHLPSGDPWVIHVSKKALSLLSLLQKNNLSPQLAIDQWVLFSLYI